MTASVLPESLDALRAVIADAHAEHATAPPLDLTSLDRILAFSPDDLTVTVESGITVDALQRALADAGQWLPIDPPQAASTSVADLLQFDISGPRRYGYGTVREHVLGLTVITGDGRLVRSGGRVVKNVAGYDLARLFIGDRRTLGVIVEATFKLMPRPAGERILQKALASLDEVEAEIEALIAGPTEPVVIDLHSLDRSRWPWTLVVAYAGHPDDVAWQVARHDEEWESMDAMEHERFWEGRRWASAHRVSVLPSTLVDHLRGRPAGDLLSRAGNGVVYAFDEPSPDMPAASATQAPGVVELTRRLVDTFDPRGVFRREGDS